MSFNESVAPCILFDGPATRPPQRTPILELEPMESGLVVTIRRILLGTLLLSLTGTVSELLLLEHFEDAWQWTPIVLIGSTLLSLGWFSLAKGAGSLNVFRSIMVLCLVSGIVGVALHYKGNVEFELEMYPDMSGWKLFKETMMGATPALAPGAMAQIGLIGLAWAFRHPAGRPKETTT